MVDSHGQAAGSRPSQGQGARLREARQARQMSLRELSRRVNVSPGHLSQIERDLVAPSISLLYAIVSELGVSMDSLFDHGTAAARPAAAAGDPDIPRVPGESRYVRRFDERQAIEVSPGVRWELLTPSTDAGIDFREIIYSKITPPPPDEAFIRHHGHEYGLVLEGRLHAQVEFDTFVLGPGDSIAFESSRPHRFWNEGPGVARAVWVSNVPH
ncbi:hypothetical protein A5731_01830 [Mycolicibacterium conceptionense]|uniref:HTH cro/C1-type domain-containing protein n=1 Tax=Mycolicibacterium conceptionense TaxID=451644 RepID=A0A1A1XKE6_9MYCO|nr:MULTISPECIES: cupin domain-containing protein [Mycolicibacterium]MCW1822297.1 cupin domain-containing protein [Mycolicibacterium senegalense]OBB05484.1 hypothetical protein A5718_22150 [Mycolicibacterium conceptionense]OBE96083.1 hypothetical protein A5731_01830 [Mycolicibacterium conceptionense]OBF19618.1 hypothetical protein A5726_17340 [Mycolicibacterium conceptionense]OBF48146.1 hypothetical protein A5720_03705 [Mycolicibacterium conceptionense]